MFHCKWDPTSSMAKVIICVLSVHTFQAFTAHFQAAGVCFYWRFTRKLVTGQITATVNKRIFVYLYIKILKQWINVTVNHFIFTLDNISLTFACTTAREFIVITKVCLFNSIWNCLHYILINLITLFLW